MPSIRGSGMVINRPPNFDKTPKTIIVKATAYIPTYKREVMLIFTFSFTELDFYLGDAYGSIVF